MRILFFGSGDFGVPTLQMLHTRHQLVGIVSQPDKPAGRNRQLTPTPAAQWGLTNQIPTLRSPDVNTPEFVAQVKNFSADASVVIAFGQKMSPDLITAAGRLAVNLHGSILPRFRGAAPINHAILAGDAVAGVSVISLAQRMDAGLVYATRSIPIDPLETAGELHDRLALLGPDLIDGVLNSFQSGTLVGNPQDESLATRAPKFAKEDSQIKFNATPEAIRRRVHGLTPWPGAKASWHRQTDSPEALPTALTLLRVAVVPDAKLPAKTQPGTVMEGGRVAAVDGVVQLLEVQVPGGKAMKIDEFLRGNRLLPGDWLE